jgi:hypothetical protein
MSSQLKANGRKDLVSPQRNDGEILVSLHFGELAHTSQNSDYRVHVEEVMLATRCGTWSQHVAYLLEKRTTGVDDARVQVRINARLLIEKHARFQSAREYGTQRLAAWCWQVEEHEMAL